MKQRKNATISISAKCSDLWSHQVIGKNGQVVSEYNGYVPSFMPGEHYGDYVLLEIDPYTGTILNWKKWKKAKKTNKKAA